jgi:RimJ/RimL family protein N-acetyltransferase
MLTAGPIRRIQGTGRNPMLIGPRVTLRALHRDDLPLLWVFNNDLAVELAGGGDPPMPQRYEQLAAAFDEVASKGGRDNADFAIEVDGRFIGTCGLFGEDATAQSVELGIGIGDKSRWGQGIGREAIGLLLEYAFRYRNYRRVWLRVHANNERGMRAYRACGFIEEGRQRQHVYSNGHYHDLVLMGILRSEWEAAQTGEGE